MALTKEQVTEALARLRTPRGVSLVHSGVMSEITLSDGSVMFSFNVDAAEVRAWESVRASAEEAVRGIAGVKKAMVALTAERKASAPREGVQPAAQHRPAPHGGIPPKQAIPGIKAVIAVASGKGGVGKSTTALNLALGLRDAGLSVGLMDADIYGPSVPRLTGLREKPVLNDAKKMVPLQRFGLAIMSIGFVVAEDTAMVWRGPMVMSAVNQLLRDVAWGERDVLVVDMPPGTGDAQLTLAQSVPLQGVVIVSTPQDLALVDARRGIAMFEKVNVPILGIVENMSYFQCPHCGGRSDIFGHGGARHEAEKLGVPFLGEIPLHMDIRANSDAGTPVVDSDPQSDFATIYRGIAARIAERLKG